MTPAPQTSPPPPGQRWRSRAPRFGLWPYAGRFPAEPERRWLDVVGPDGAPRRVDAHALEPYRQDLVAPLHCVTTWSVDGLRWSGFPLRQVWALASAAWPAAPDPGGWVMLRGQDGYRTLLPLTDLLAEGVLLADRLEGRPLPVEHGAPWRLVAPAHYGYKQVKHLARLTWCAEVPAQWGSGWRFMDHPRARVALEERGQGWPGWLLRRLYRPLIAPTVWHFARRARHAPVAARKEEAS